MTSAILKQKGPARPWPAGWQVQPLHVAILVGLLAITLQFRLAGLDYIPGEFYGDIDIIYEAVTPILHGERPMRFIESNGPLYGYIIAPVIAVVGQQGYYPYKLASVLVSLAGVLFLFLLAWELGGFRLAVLASLILATSSWYLVFSRLGNSQILVPVVTAACFYCLVLGAKRHSLSWTAMGLAVTSLGYYMYPQTFVLPWVYLLCARFYVPWRRWGLLAVLAVAYTIPFALLVARQQDLFFSGAGYIGSKWGSSEAPAQKILENVAASLLMLHVRGDPLFRSNPPNVPQLDLISGLFFLPGVVYWLRPPQRVWLPVLLLPLLLLLVPANLVLNEAHPTPSASRTTAILPFVALFVAGGIWWVYDWLGRRPVWQKPLLALVVVGILALNWYRYFWEYSWNLPDHNVPYGKVIAEYLDNLPADAAALVYSCCWGSWGQPEPKGIRYVVRVPRDIAWVPAGQFSCALLATLPRPLYIVWDPREATAAVTPAICDPTAESHSYRDPYNRSVFTAYELSR